MTRVKAMTSIGPRRAPRMPWINNGSAKRPIHAASLTSNLRVAVAMRYQRITGDGHEEEFPDVSRVVPSPAVAPSVDFTKASRRRDDVGEGEDTHQAEQLGAPESTALRRWFLRQEAGTRWTPPGACLPAGRGQG